MIGVLATLGLVWGARNSSALGLETLDRIVASVDNAAITRSDTENAYGFELILEGKMPEATPDEATRETVRNRQIDQLLLLREADSEGIAGTEAANTPEDALADIRKKFGNDEKYEAALRSIQMNEPMVLERLRNRQRILLLIDRRLRPSARVESPDLEDYYKSTFVPELARRTSNPAPPLAEVEGQIREILTQKKIDQLLTAWLENLKVNHRVDVHPF